ncbi:MAG TPA: polyisoprenoid-binding protein [Micavibrio sp.]|nr:polyisoprenoid-binding protein [Micavibrio sp.]HIL29771.1 polyisoprenoid-binding protein [Micavibrio sp.]
MKKLLMMATAAGFLFVAQPAKAEVETYEFDKPHTSILFFADHLGFSKSQGEFHDYDGHFTFDRENPANSAVEVTIQTASIDMDMEKWDDHLKNADFFNVEEFPTMTFKSSAIEVTGEKTGKITGDLTLLGVTKPVTLDVVFHKAGEFPMGDMYKAGFTATAMIDRSEWGMNYGLPAMDKMVEIRIEVEGNRVDPNAAEAPAEEAAAEDAEE